MCVIKDALKNIMMYQFCAIDLNLYLDNFPDDKNAREDYDKVSCKLTSLVHDYEKVHGPLTNFGSAFVENPKAWVDDFSKYPTFPDQNGKIERILANFTTFVPCPKDKDLNLKKWKIFNLKRK